MEAAKDTEIRRKELLKIPIAGNVIPQ